jgi:hypothetical protein
MAKSIEELEAEKAAAEALAQQYNAVNDALSKKLALEQKVVAELKEEEIQQRKLIEATKNGTEAEKQAAGAAIAAARARREELEKLTSQLGEVDDSVRNISSLFAKLFSGKAPDLKGMLDPNNIKSLGASLKSANLSMGAAQIATAAAGAALFAYTKAIVDLVFELDAAEVGFMKVTGANRDFARSITNSFAETRKFGASAKETSAAAEALFTGFTDFTFASEQTRESLTETGTVLARMGVSNQDFAKSIQISTKALGMSAEQAGQSMLNLEKFAENLGVAPQQMAADFANAGDMVAKLGQNGEKAFKDLQVTMKVTGMSMESILNLTNKFDTFEGAAEQAGKLNAALGGNFVNAMDLMMATNPAERFEMIRDSIMDTGLSFEDMSYYQKKFFAESMGLKDVNELALLMSDNIDLMDGAVQQSQQSMVDAAKRARDLQTIQEKLNTAFAQLIPIITPLIDLLVYLSSAIASSATEGGLLSGIFKGFAAPFKLLGSVIGLILPFFEDFFEEISENKEIMDGLGSIIEFIGYALGVVLVSALLAVIAPIGAVTAKIVAITASFFALADLIFQTPFNPPNFLQGLFEIADGFMMIAQSALMILNPFSLVASAIKKIGGVFSDILGGVTSFFTAITDPSAAENVKKIAAAISEVSIPNAGAFTAAMTATAGATATRGALGGTQTGGVQNGDKPYEVTINVMLDRDKLASVVQEINGEAAREAIAQRG